ncbi:MAG: MFS transporter [Pseudomonadota bacterium]|nr:MFS transporter [Pseudomonadota bacterium]
MVEDTTNKNNTVDTKPTKGYAAYVLLMLSALYTVNYVDRFLVSGLLDPIKDSLDVSNTYMGFLVGPAFALFYTTLAIPIARLADRYSRVKIIVTGTLVWSLFTVLSGFAETPEAFLIARIGVGIGEAAFLAPAFSLLADYYPPRRRTMAFAILNLGVYFGQMGGLIGGPAIESVAGWQAAFIALGLPGIILAVLAIITIREPIRGQLDDARSQDTQKDEIAIPIKALAALLIKTRSYLMMTAGTALGGFAGYGFGYWGPTLFSRGFNLSLTEAGGRFAISFGISGLFGALLMGFMCDRLAQKNHRWPFWLSAGGVAGSMAFMMAVCLTENVQIATLLAFPAGLLGGGWVVALQAALQDLLPGNIRATSSSIWAFALTFAGLVGGVQFAGFMIDIFAAYPPDYAIRYALTITLLPCIPASFLIASAGYTIVSDREKLKQTLASETN